MVDLNIELPEGFLDEEIRCDYVVSSDMKKVWAVEMDMLSQLQKVCEKHNIKYFASGGTLLGAVRHKGFIPWDDDIDVAMLRDDYEKLCSLADEFKYPYEFQCYKNTKGYFTGHAQIRNTQTTGVLKTYIETHSIPPYNQGIFIDIFPLDAVPDDERIQKKFFKKINFYKTNAMRAYNCTDGYNAQYASIKRKAARIIFKLIYPIINYDRLFKKFEMLCQKYNKMNTEYVSMLSFNSIDKRLWIAADNLKNIITVPYEMMDINISSNYDEVLKVQYDDYTVFVKGGSYHGGIIFDAENAFEEFQKLI